MQKIIISCLILFLATAHAATPIIAKNGMVVSEQRLASQIGAAILRQGGNAIDAAVAVGYALAVVDPCCGNIGGGGFLVARLANGKNIFLNFRERAPLKASNDMYYKTDKKTASLEGYLAVGVPGTVLGLDTALQKYGTLPRQTVMAPAIKLADKGFIITPYQAATLRPYTDTFRQQPNVAAIFLKNGKPLQPGDRLIQKELANTLRKIAAQGPTAFYHGSIAETIVAASKANGGILTLKDFADYKVQFLKPIICHYHQYTIISAAPPSSGGVALCEMLNILENFPIKQSQFYNPETIREIVEAMRYSFNDRNYKLGDPDFIHNPISQLTSKQYAKSISNKIRAQQKVKVSPTVFPQKELTDTTHYSIVDRYGNGVAVTYTINGFFGAHVIAGDTGFFLNNEMDDFATIPGTPNKFGLVQHDANAVKPGKRPLSSMTPTIITKNGKLFMVIGSPGGPRIITAVLLTILHVLNNHLNVQDAVNAPRFHHQGQPDQIDIEPDALSSDTMQQLTQLGYQLYPQPQPWGAVAAILINKKQFYGANDIRRPDGAAIGVK